MKKVIITAAGRKRYLEILFLYLLKAYREKEFDEWLLWMNTSNAEDNEYLDKLAKKYNWIKKVYCCNPDEYPKALDPEMWKNFHKFYSLDGSDPDSIYLKIDDDIVFIEDNAIRSMFEFREKNPQYFIVIGNVINNALCGHIHQRIGVIGYEKGINLYDCFCNVAWKSPQFAEYIHQQFIKNRFNTYLYKFPLWELWAYERISINVFSWFGSRFAKFKGNVPVDEEQALSVVLPRQFKEMNCINGQAIFSHFAFYTQRDYLDTTNLLDLYKKIAPVNSFVKQEDTEDNGS